MASAVAAFQRADSLTQMQLKADSEMHKKAGRYAMSDDGRGRAFIEGMGEIQQPAPVLYNGGERFAMDDIMIDDCVSDWLLQGPPFEDQALPTLPQAPPSPRIIEREPSVAGIKRERSDVSSEGRKTSHDESTEEKRERVKKRRRESARRSRARKNTYVKSLELENLQLREENRKLKGMLSKVDRDIPAGFEYSILDMQ